MSVNPKDRQGSVLSHGVKIHLYVFLAFLLTLFTFVAIISAPVVLRDVGSNGLSTTARYRQTLEAEDYIINGYVSTTTIGSTISRRFHHRTEARYYSVTVAKGPDAGREILVRVIGDELDSLERGEPVTLYGLVSVNTQTYGNFSKKIPCLNDNGESVLTQWLTSLAFLLGDAGVIVLWNKIHKRLKSQKLQAQAPTA